MGWLTEHPVLGWLTLALALGVAEMATLDFLFLMLVGGALGAAVAAALGAPFVVQVLVAVGVALLLLALVRPLVVRRVHATPPHETGTAALVGRDALVVETLTSRGGRIKLAGEVWSARIEPAPRPRTIEPGRSVRVLAIEGATALVRPACPEPEISS